MHLAIVSDIRYKAFYLGRSPCDDFMNTNLLYMSTGKVTDFTGRR